MSDATKLLQQAEKLDGRVSDMLPTDFKVHHKIGKGSNNSALSVTWEGELRVLRIPRRKSDTQQRGSSKWEYLHTARASQLGVGPKVYAAWHSRHAEEHWPSGLYMVMEHFPHDLEQVMEKERQKAVEHKEAIGTSIVHALTTLADDNMFVYDLKPSNIVLRFDHEGVVAKIIDYGRDFCEWRTDETDKEIDSNAPIIGMLSKIVESNKLIQHILFASMLVQLSSTTSRSLYEDRRSNKMSAEERKGVNPVAPFATRLLDSMQGRNVQLMRIVLRMDDVRGVLRHYHGRRNAGTRRTICFAKAERC